MELSVSDNSGLVEMSERKDGMVVKKNAGPVSKNNT